MIDAAHITNLTHLIILSIRVILTRIIAKHEICKIHLYQKLTSFFQFKCFIVELDKLNISSKCCARRARHCRIKNRPRNSFGPLTHRIDPAGYTSHKRKSAVAYIYNVHMHPHCLSIPCHAICIYIRRYKTFFIWTASWSNRSRLSLLGDLQCGTTADVRGDSI